MSLNDFAALLVPLGGSAGVLYLLGKGVAWLVDRLRDRSARTIRQLRAENEQLKHDLNEERQLRRIAELP